MSELTFQSRPMSNNTYMTSNYMPKLYTFNRHKHINYIKV